MKRHPDGELGRLRALLDRWLDKPVHRDLRTYRSFVESVNQLESTVKKLDDHALEQLCRANRQRVLRGESVDAVAVEVFALVRESARRAIGLRAFDVQMLGALAMHRGLIAEMQTGEGKTLTAVFTAVLNALSGGGLHILTANDYLARRDAAWMGPVYKFFGLEVGCIQHSMNSDERRNAYLAHITYATPNELGFDFLRDCLSVRLDDATQRPFSFAIIDEIDSILIDEARIPLVIAGGRFPIPDVVSRAGGIVRRLSPQHHYNTDRYGRTVFLTEAGISEVERILGLENLYDEQNLSMLTALNLALQAEALMRRDIDYIVRGGRIHLVDEFKGRLAHMRRWAFGLQSAVEAKEGIPLSEEAEVLSTITLHDLIALYPKKSGMSATAASSANEFREFFDLEVLVVPPNRQCIRKDLPDFVFTHIDAKETALVQEITRVHATGRPILVGTRSIDESERLAQLLIDAGVNCQVLNAKNDEVEAEIVAEAGKPGAVTISTNMAGRGTDIRLGGADESLRAEVVALGGLYVIGTNRHESPRIDRQLCGRAGRQGDPGSSRFFVSLEDELIVKYGARRLVSSFEQVRNQPEPLDDDRIARRIEWSQDLIDALNFQIRANLCRYHAVIEEQRRIVHSWRQDLLQDRAPLKIVLKRAPDRYRELSMKVGPDVLRDVEAKLTLFHIDQEWATHLATLSFVREGVYFRSRVRLDPYVEFRREAIASFDQMLVAIKEGVVRSFLSAEITISGIDLEREGLVRPSATWTYLLGDTPASRERYSLLDVAKKLAGRRAKTSDK